MTLLKQIPIHYKGELHDVRLINFSVALDEVKDKIPKGINPRNFDGRALFSMVDVKLKNMHPSSMPFLRFNYRHIAFRLLVEDSMYNDGVNKGIYFYKSFANKALIVAGGKLLTDYNLEHAQIEESNNEVLISQDNQRVRYCVGSTIGSCDEVLKKTIGALDRAYSVLGASLRVTQIQREKWPIQPVQCLEFENSFFKTARLEGAFRVFETIYYEWLPPSILRL